jgi:peptide subunit release factor RF-3
LAAADNAVMLVDGGKGLEPQTRKLFEVRFIAIQDFNALVEKL